MSNVEPAVQGMIAASKAGLHVPLVVIYIEIWCQDQVAGLVKNTSSIFSLEATVGASVNDALQSPPNPRNPGPAVPPVARLWELPAENADTASVILTSMHTANQSAKSNVSNPQLLQRGNFSHLQGAARAMKLPRDEEAPTDSKAPSNIHIKLTSIINKKAPKAKRNLGFYPYTLSKPRDVSFDKVLKEIEIL
ncbi:hypothetical protein H0H92_011880, partial [Tricholoma furcatifolium]